MGFYSRVKEEFDRATEVNGRKCFRSGRVSVIHGSATQVIAAVKDAPEEYISVLEWRNGRLQSVCSCAGFGHGHCPHVAATAIAADDLDLLHGVPSYGRIRLHAAGPHGGGATAEEADADGDFDDTPPQPRRRPRTRSQPPAWAKTLGDIDTSEQRRVNAARALPRSGKEILYAWNAGASSDKTNIELLTLSSFRKAGAARHIPSYRPIASSQVDLLPEADRRVMALLFGADTGRYGWSRAYGARSYSFQCSVSLFRSLLTPLCSTGRFHMVQDGKALTGPLSRDDGPPWRLHLKVEETADARHWRVRGALLRGEVELPFQELQYLHCDGILVARDQVAEVELDGTLGWASILQPDAHVLVPRRDGDALLQRLWTAASAPPIVWPEPLRLPEAKPQPCPLLRLRKRSKWSDGGEPLGAEVSFRYNETVVRMRRPGDRVGDLERRCVVIRNRELEGEAVAALETLGFKPPPQYIVTQTPIEELHDFEIAGSRLPGAVRALIEKGWHVEAEGKLYRRPGEFKLEVTSGIDWFDVGGELDFDGQAVKLPALLAAVRRGETSVVLGDGTIGMLPESWLKKYGFLLQAGTAEADSIRFRRTQVGLLDALLAAQPQVSVDAVFERARKELREFDGVRSAAAPASFAGKLRRYQEEGLGWLEFLRRFGFGGCLADDMGLGKTVQVLALLDSLRAQAGGVKERRAPALVVVPRSLIFNWKVEAERFTPNLRILDHAGADRVRGLDHLGDYDVVLTTYGMLRRDIPYLKDFTFDTVILDEAQAIKTAGSESAKAARLLSARQRLALSGTPIENHLGELWSLFEFLNPGMLGGSSALKLVAGGSGRSVDPELLPVLRSALRPFILRRRKEDVAADLPPKLEQTLFCELEADDKRRYDELRDHYRAKVLGLVDRDGLKNVQFHVLEALLRLRQAACHPALIDKAMRAEPSAKLETLLEQLKQVWKEGHKALVFSQFTQFLGIVKQRLDGEGIPYEYLDGKTRDRQSRVERFQTDADCKVFLVSLKAGGLGLNLTAAEYVFLLDPWWNPAVEAQAIDRAHRIGQTRRVFAYRLVARGTVEEKVLELQKTKRELADSIINDQGAGLRTLTREDLERLLS